ncbi:MAG TPA: TolC family protein [Vicinamibacterales bacterium]|nr:TolC family protein [Vicinamibacterales bacterium]
MSSARGSRGDRRTRAAVVSAASAVVLGLFALPARAQTPPAPAAPAPPVAAAQTLPLRTVEFADAIREALERNPTIGQAAQNVTRAQALVAQARALTFPSVSASIAATTLDKELGFDGAVTQPRNQISVTGNASYVFGGFAVVRQARDQADVATASSVQARQSVAVAAADAYLAVIAARRQVQVATQAVETAQAHLDYADRRLQGGAGSRLNQLRAAQAVSADRLQLEQAQLGLRRAQEALGVVLAGNDPVDAGAEPVFDVPATIDEDAWMRARPDLVTQMSIQRAAERVVRDSWIDWTPFPTVSFAPQVVAPSGLFQPSRTWRLTISATQPIFDGGQRRATKRVRQTAVDTAKLELTGLEIQARSEVRVAQEAVQRLERAQAIAREAVDQAAEVLRITTAAFEVGATTNIEVIDAQRSLRDAEVAAASSEDAVRHAKLDLLVAIGQFPQ